MEELLKASLLVPKWMSPLWVLLHLVPIEGHAFHADTVEILPTVHAVHVV